MRASKSARPGEAEPGKASYPFDETWKQATSYCETAALFAGVFVVCPFPAYIAPAVPPFSLNAEHGAPAAWPGSVGAVELRHVCDG